MQPNQTIQSSAPQQLNPATPIIYQEEKAWYREPGFGFKSTKKVKVVVTHDGILWVIDPVTNQTLWNISIKAPNEYKIQSAFFIMKKVGDQKFGGFSAKNPYVIQFYNQYYVLLLSNLFLFAGMARASRMKKALKEAGL